MLTFLKGKRTLIINGLMLLTYLLAWDQLTQYLSPQVIAGITTAVNVGLRFITTSPVLTSGPPQ